MDNRAVRLQPFADGVHVATFRADDLPTHAHWLVQQLLFPAEDERLFSLTDTDREVTLLLVCFGASFRGAACKAAAVAHTTRSALSTEMLFNRHRLLSVLAVNRTWQSVCSKAISALK